MLDTKSDVPMTRVARGMRGYLDWAAHMRGFRDYDDRERNEFRDRRAARPVKDWLSTRLTR